MKFPPDIQIPCHLYFLSYKCWLTVRPYGERHPILGDNISEECVSHFSCFFGSCWKCLHPSQKGADDNKSYLCPWLRETLVKSTSISSNGVSPQYFVPTSLKGPWQALFCKVYTLLGTEKLSWGKVSDEILSA